MMKTTLWQLLIGVIVLTASAQAQLQDVAITVTRKKLDEQKSRQSMETVTTREYAYTVILSSHSFKSLPMVEVKYMIFYEDAQPGRKEKPETLHVKGKETLANLENNRPVSFEPSRLNSPTPHWTETPIGPVEPRARQEMPSQGCGFASIPKANWSGNTSTPPQLPRRTTGKNSPFNGGV